MATYLVHPRKKRPLLWSTHSVVILDGKGSHGDTGHLLPEEIPSDVQEEEVLWEKGSFSG